MPVLPTGTDARIQWFEQRIVSWQANALAIGLTDAQVTQLSTYINLARTRYDAAQAARIAAKNATLGLHNAAGDLFSYGSDLIQAVKIFAETTGDPNVYTLASVPPPAPPTPAGAPKPPTDVSADPNADGTVTVSWKGSLAHQTFYTVWRKPAGAAAFTQVASISAKTFTDPTVPAGVASIAYVVRAQRGLLVSANSDETVVNFGGSAQAAAA